jgi:hypothetical protein
MYVIKYENKQKEWHPATKPWSFEEIFILPIYEYCQRQGCPEMEFLNGIFNPGFCMGINSSLLFSLSGFLPSKFCSNAIYEFSCFADFFVWVFKNQRIYGFSENPFQ